MATKFWLSIAPSTSSYLTIVPTNEAGAVSASLPHFASMTSSIAAALNSFQTIISSLLHNLPNCFIFPLLFFLVITGQTCGLSSSSFLVPSNLYFSPLMGDMASIRDEKHFGKFFIEWPIWARLTLVRESQPRFVISLTCELDSGWRLCPLLLPGLDLSNHLRFLSYASPSLSSSFSGSKTESFRKRRPLIK